MCQTGSTLGGVRETLDQPWSQGHRARKESGPPRPGLVLVFSGKAAKLEVIPLEDGALAIGRGRVGRTVIDDACMSRRHAEVELRGDTWHIRDLGSRNGTAVDAVRVTGSMASEDARFLRTGDSLFLLSHDVRRYQSATVDLRDGLVVGPTLREKWNEIDAIAAAADLLHVTGESGSGKEHAARRFHASSARHKGPFVSVNCASIPVALAERLLFGAKRGAFSGADADVDGHVQAADGGTLVLDEVAELDLPVQSKLLRLVENREVLPLGGARARKVDLRICTATHRDLKARVATGAFREDLYFRLGRPSVSLPPLRERAEDIPWLVQTALEGGKPPHVSIVELALARPWPGNVRELLLEVREAARAASSQECDAVEARHCAVSAGLRAGQASGAEVEAPRKSRRRSEPPPTTTAMLDALRANAGNVARTARALGVHRTQLRRWLDRDGVDPKTFGGDDS
jgi:transcriptional regulator with PAS, ATPase and Fis domain